MAKATKKTPARKSAAKPGVQAEPPLATTASNAVEGTDPGEPSAFEGDGVELDNAGAPHQTTEDGHPTLTTQTGTPIADDQSHLRVGARGPMLMEDFHLREKIFHFDHERIPERVVHARGYGAHGFFELTDPLTDITRADLFQRAGEQTPVFVRFSTVAGSKGSFDLARDVRGFAVKFYTREGNWDLVGNNIPVFFIQDAIKFPDLVHAVKPEPDRGFPQAQSAHDNFWDFISLSPESMHMIMWVMSDRAIPRSFRFMEGFGVHTFKFLNADGEMQFVKFHWKPKLGLQSVCWNEAVKINGADPDFHRRDLWQAITTGNFPEWELNVQVFDEEFAEQFAFDVLDPTKLIPEEDVPLRPVGRLVLNRMVDNFFAETEQVAFCTQNIVPGIDFSDDPLLQGRNFSYLDTQVKRLGGPNFTHIPINAPRCPFAHFQQDGHMAMHNPKGRANYEPNSWGPELGGPREDPVRGFRSHEQAVEGAKVRARSETFADHFSQTRQFYVSQEPIEQKHIADALTFELSKVETLRIRERMVGQLRNIDEDLAAKVADGLALENVPDAIPPAREPITDLAPSAPLSIVANGPKRFEGRKLGVFITDGADAALLDALEAAVEAAGGTVEIIAPKVGGAVLSDDALRPAHHKIDGGPSVLFDAVALLISEEGASLLLKDAATRDFIADAFGHMKFIGYTEATLPLLEKAGIADALDEGCVALKAKTSVKSFVDALGQLRLWDREMNVDLDA